MGKNAKNSKARVADKTAFVAYELMKFQVDIACLQEIRWVGQGESEEMDGYLFYYSGSKTGEKKYGVGIAIAKRLNMEWNRITYLIE
jgi:exonuclease III